MKMHVFLYEWITGGGLVEEKGALPLSLLAEGSAMMAALAADFAAFAGCRVSVLRDVRLEPLPVAGCEVLEVHSTADWAAEFDRLAAAADRTLIVAPEFDGILRTTLRRVRGADGRSLNAGDPLVAVASDKHQTAERLRAAGVPAPRGRLLDADEEKLPADFAYPAVLKPLDGAGSQHMLLVGGPGDEPPPYPWQRRLEQFWPGRAASVAVLCGPAGRHALPPCWQHLSSDGRFRYRGGAMVREASLAERAKALALRALGALPEAHGFVGVDLVLGTAMDGGEDAVIEVNPRVTTSYVGLRAAVHENLAQAMIDVADGARREFTLRDETVEFSADGNVWAGWR